MLPHLYIIFQQRVLSGKYTKMFSCLSKILYKFITQMGWKWLWKEWKRNKNKIQRYRLVEQKAITWMKEKLRIKVHIALAYQVWKLDAIGLKTLSERGRERKREWIFRVIWSICSMFISLFKINSLFSRFRTIHTMWCCSARRKHQHALDIKQKWLHIYDDEFFLWSHSEDENKSIRFIAHNVRKIEKQKNVHSLWSWSKTGVKFGYNSSTNRTLCFFCSLNWHQLFFWPSFMVFKIGEKNRANKKRCVHFLNLLWV